MASTQNNFISQVRKKAVKSPTEMGFTESAWTAAWNASKDNEESDKQLYQAGIVFSGILGELREEIGSLYKTPARASSRELITAYCGMANRDAFLISKPHGGRGADLTALRSSSNRLGNELSLDEIANGCVDGVDIAIRQLVRGKVPTGSGPDSMDAFEFLQKELDISQLYGLYESYWRALLWGEYKFSDIGDSKYEVQQMATDFSVAYEASQLRNDRIMASAVQFVTDQFYLARLGRKSCLTWIRNGKKKSISVATVSSLSEEYQYANAMLIYQAALLEDHFPVDFLKSAHGNLGFTVLDAVEVFRLLIILARVSLNNFPDNDGVSTLNKAAKFCPSANRNELLRGISKATGGDFSKSAKILDFLSFDGDRDKDLWCHPVIDLGDGNVTYLVAALKSPVLQRVVEHWLVKMNVDLAEKGRSFETLVTSEINSAINNNSLFADHDPAVGRRFNLDERGSEEIDLLLRVGNVIVIGEIKSIVTTDSPISLFRTRETIIGAQEQVKRKSNYLAENMELIFEKLGWNFRSKETYRIVPIILTSSSICVGYSVNDVPVCDLRIFKKYFESNIIPLVSASKDEHIAWLEIYNNFDEAQKNLEEYLRHPPQQALSADDFEHITCYMPVVTKNSPKIAFTRLAKRPLDVSNMLKKSYSFPLRFSDNFQEKVSEADAFI